MEGRYNILIAATLFLLLSVNIVFLDILVFGKTGEKDNVTPVSVSEPVVCPAACTPLFTDIMNTKLAVPAGSVSAVVKDVSVVSSPKEYYIPLGSGMTKHDTWETVTGVEATIDTSLYPKIKQVIFESYLRIPVGIGWMHVKLYNVTDGHDVWGSEVQTESNTAIYRSAPITLDPGSKRYIVMAESTIRADAYIDNARIKILTY